MQPNIQTLTFPVTGMSCATCAVSVESILGAQNGVEKAEINYATQLVKMAFHPEVVQPDNLQQAVQSIGYDLIIDTLNGKAKQGSEPQETTQFAEIYLRNHYDVIAYLDSSLHTTYLKD
jgi:Cu2+-exporting ATPase